MAGSTKTLCRQDAKKLSIYTCKLLFGPTIHETICERVGAFGFDLSTGGDDYERVGGIYRSLTG